MRSPEISADGKAVPRFAAWATVLLLGAGYIGVYLCRKNLAVAIPILKDISGDAATVGWISTIGSVFYAVGKFVNGPLVDRIGGKSGFVLSLLGVAAFAAASALAPGIGVLCVLYGLNRFVGAGGWGSIMKLVPTWFTPRRTSLVIAILSVSYVLGGTAATMLARGIHAAGGGWQAIMALPSIIPVILAVIAFFALRAGPLGPARAREPAPPSVVGYREAAPMSTAPRTTTGHGFSWAALGKLLRRRNFIIACSLSFVVTLVREAFNTWSVDFLTSVQGGLQSLDLASFQSTSYDVAGVLGILGMGAVYGYIRPKRRGWLIAGSLLALAVTLALLPVAARTDPLYAVILLAPVGFLVYGPFSLLSGVMALEVGGGRLVATAAGFIDGVGYLGGALAGASLGALLDLGGYDLTIHVLAVLAFAAAVLAMLFRPAPVEEAVDEVG